MKVIKNFMILDSLEKFILDSTNAKEILSFNKVQTLWSGYGEIVKIKIKGENIFTVVIKNIIFPDSINTSFSHQRKSKSYEVEMNWYQYWSHLCNDKFKTPKCLGIKKDEYNFAFILEDMDSSGYPLRLKRLNKKESMLCLKWLANFHAYFMNVKSEHLWEIGTYWHLDTRPDELENIKDSFLKKMSGKIDSILNNCIYKTFVHGDAKTDNFCFSEDLSKVSAVDFQYVGNGCGMKDIAYFFDSALSEKQCHDWEEELLNFYFKELNNACIILKKDINLSELEKEWRYLYNLCWADFYRFLLGWIPETNIFNSFNLNKIEKTLMLLEL
jgi:hypothetical protein